MTHRSAGRIFPCITDEKAVMPKPGQIQSATHLQPELEAQRPTGRRFARPAAWQSLAAGVALAGSSACAAQALSNAQGGWQPSPQQRVAVTLNTNVVHQPLTWQPRGGNPDTHAQPSAQSSLGLEFRRKSGSQSAKDLLKVQLTADSALNFRPRGGGMVVTYRSHF